METWSQNLNINQILHQYSSPVYIFNSDWLKLNFNAYVKFTGKPEHILYPVKANPSFAVLSEIAGLGGGADCASEDEIELALFAGFPLQNIYYNTPTPHLETVLDLLKKGGTFVVDSREFLEELASHYKPFWPGKIFVRVNPAFPVQYKQKTNWENLVAHAQQQGKFGIASEEIVSLLRATPLKICGLHLHVGTQMDHLDSFSHMLDFLHDLADTIRVQTKQRIEYLDLGGGLGIPFLSQQKFPSIAQFTARLKSKKRKEFSYLVEPGHSLVGNTMALLTQITTLKLLRGKRWGIVDVGTNQLAKITLLQWPHRILKQDGTALSLKGTDSLGGPLCFAGDTLLKQTDLKGLKKGDPLLIQHCGAYCYALGNHFNGQRIPGEIILKKGKIRGYSRLPGDSQLGLPHYSYMWNELWNREKKIFLPIKTRDIKKLGSSYLNREIYQDQYKILSAHQVSVDVFDFVIHIKASVPFVSLPFALRIAGDALIIAILKFIGKSVKDISIWGTRCYLTADKKIVPNRKIKCRISLSHLISQKESKDQSILAHYDLDEGKFTGTLRLVI